MACYDLFIEEHKREEFIFVHASQTFDYFGSGMMYNPAHKFYKKYPPNYFSIMFNFLFPLRPPVRQKVDRFVREQLGKYSIAIEWSRVEPWKQMSAPLPPNPPISLIFQSALSLSSQQTAVEVDDVTWFLVNTNSTTAKSLQSKVINSIVTYSSIKDQDDEEDDETRQLIELYIMGMADEVITMETSSFGSVAAARTGRHAVMCGADGFCMRKLTSQPVQMFPMPPAPQCDGTYNNVENWSGWSLSRSLKS
eukprot:TRINITY_DN5015_c0_g2_i2.p1 TRINITY_DN5015_c0_g2~~TRINITY_DN5015_c0_g2_i2.p1  ORF type:complete len:251 (+),score=49.51 TRINITY_DN5015_c0_g2_i2:693-1445(+)